MASLLLAAALVPLAAAQTATPSPSPSPASLCNARLVAGNGTNGEPPEGSQAAISGLGNVHGLVANGTVMYVSDGLHLKVRRLDLRTGAITTFLGNGGGSGTFLGELATQAPLGWTQQGAILPNGDFAVCARCTAMAVSQVSATPGCKGSPRQSRRAIRYAYAGHFAGVRGGGQRHLSGGRQHRAEWRVEQHDRVRRHARAGAVGQRRAVHLQLQ
jgi:hypothetical protein